MTRTDRIGRAGERVAERYLRRRGWRILARNRRGGGGELDLVAARAGVVAIVEVKTRGSPEALAETLTAAQRRRLLSAAASFVAARPELARAAVRFDLVTVGPGRPWRRIRHDAGVFDAGGMERTPRRRRARPREPTGGDSVGSTLGRAAARLEQGPHMVSTRVKGGLAAVVAILVAGGLSAVAMAKEAPLIGAEQHEVKGMRVGGRCVYPLTLVLLAGQDALEQRVVADDAARCEAMVERDIPSVIERGAHERATVATGQGSPVLNASTEDPRRGRAPRMHQSLASRSSGYYRTCYQDPPGIDVSGVRSTVTWTWNGSSTSSVTCDYYS